MTPSLPLSHHFGCSIIEIEEHLKQANHLVNPNSGIANDFLNQYNEILLLVENLPVLLPEMVDDLLAWRPGPMRTISGPRRCWVERSQ